MNENFGLYLHSLRKKQHLTQLQLANLLCVSPQAISNWERGLTIPDIQFILPLSEIFSVPPERILYLLCGKFYSPSIEKYLASRKEKL